MDLAFCSRCGRLMADEPGELCDRCDPSLRRPRIQSKPAFFKRSPATWALIGVTIIVSCVAFAFSSSDSLLGSAFGPAVLHGHWWLLITALFVHFNAEHLIDNLIFLWIFGERVERIVGPKTSIGLYLTCGLAGGILVLVFDPEADSCGASGAIMGFSGVLFGYYGLKFKILSGKQRLKFLLLLIWCGLVFYGGLHDPSEGDIAHISGLCAGILLGVIFALRPAWDRQAKLVLFAGAGAVLLAMTVWAEVRNAGTHPPHSDTGNIRLINPRIKLDAKS